MSNVEKRVAKHVYTVTTRNGKHFWTKIGEALVNADGTISLRLECLPINGTAEIRDRVPS